MSVTFELEGQEFIGLNGGPMFTFSPAISFFVNCETQEEVDELWTKLSEGGEKQPCGWLQDRFGVTWQIVPTVLGAMLQDKDPGKSKRVMEAMLKMSKLDIGLLKQAYEGHKRFVTVFRTPRHPGPSSRVRDRAGRRSASIELDAPGTVG
jgi:hypothetical protein